MRTIRLSARSIAVALVLASWAALPAHADRRYFTQSYTPYLAPAENLELEAASIARSGQGDTTGTSWENRLELEYGVTDRLTASAYLNFVQPAGGATSFDGPSLELIYRLTEPGRWPIEPAAYFEARANGSEVELEPKLLLGGRIYKLVGVANVAGEFEHHGAGEEKGTTERVLRVTLGASREIGRIVAIGVESVFERSFLASGPDPSSVLLGPTLNLQTPKVQFTLSWHPQISGSPDSSGGLNLADFPRSEVRLILGVDL